MRSLDDLLAASKWAGALSAEQWQRACTGIVVRELQTGNYVCRKGDPYVWVGVIDGLVKAENLSVIGKSRRIRRGAAEESDRAEFGHRSGGGKPKEPPSERSKQARRRPVSNVRRAPMR
jgi:hypothetical protein